MFKQSLFILAFSLSLVSCKKQQRQTDEQPIARVYDEFLYLSDISDQLSNGLSKEDSMRLVRRVVDDWIRDRLLLKQAEIHLPLEMKDVQKQVEEYRSSLLIFKYKQSLLNQNIDTIISEQEISDYYRDNASNYVLETDVVQATFLKIPIAAPGISDVRNWYRSDRVESTESLKAYCMEHAESFSIQDSTWIVFTTLLSKTPMRIDNPSRYLNYTTFMEARDQAFYYFIRILGRLKEGEVKPLSMVSDNIRTVLMNKRKLEYMRDLENTVYREGFSRNQAEIYK